MTFKDNFSGQSRAYVQFRPTYPAGLFDYLYTLTTGHDLAWDCGTGNGQSAISLADYYKKVYATDPSRQQIENALLHPQITYNVEQAEHCSLPGNSADIITVAQALHWFDFDKFYAEVKRVLKQNGVIAAWAYGLPVVDPEIDPVIRHFHDEIVGNYWQSENRLIDKGYTTIPFPFEQIATPTFTILRDISLTDLQGLVRSWSAVQRFIDKEGADPVLQLEYELAKLWGNPEDKRNASWQLILLAGRNIAG